MVDAESRRHERNRRADARKSFHTAQANLLEAAFRADLYITQVLAARLGRDNTEILLLRDRVFPQIPIPARLRLLREIMQGESWDDEFPFVLPVLERLFGMRNTLAHSINSNLEAIEDDDWSFTRWSYRRSGAVTETFPLSWLTSIVRSTDRVLIDLDFIWVRCMPPQFWFSE